MTHQAATISALQIVGPAGTGKTRRLIERVTELLASGASGSEILVLCATPQAARAFSTRLVAEAGEPASSVAITTARERALTIMSDRRAIAWSGRDPRILTTFEELFLMEDMKVSGLRPKRLREMLKFFYRSWTELADDDPNWLLQGEESSVHELLKENLAFYRAYIEPELANRTVNFLRENAQAKPEHQVNHVLVDDYQNHSLASQLLACELARDSLTVAGDLNACVSVFDSYPYAQGLAAFIEHYPQTKRETLVESHRSIASARATTAFLADSALKSESLRLGAPKDTANQTGDVSLSDEVTVLEYRTPVDEFLGIGDYVSHLLASGYSPCDVIIATPNRAWEKNLASVLKEQGIATSTIPSAQPIRGDIRDLDRCLEARVVTGLDMIADPSNCTAWRCWCGYGDWLVNSSAFANLRVYSSSYRKTLVETLWGVWQGADIITPPDKNTKDQTGENPSEHDVQGHVVGAQRVLEAYEAGRDLLKRAQGLLGEELLNMITRFVTNGIETKAPHVVRDLCLASMDTRDREATSAAAMDARIHQRLIFPVVKSDDAVLLAPYDQLVGLSPKVLIISGFNNGFFPINDYFDASVLPLDKQEKLHGVDMRRAYSFSSKADNTLVVSYFKTIDLEGAGKLKLKIERIRLEKGQRIASLSPSVYLPQVLGEPPDSPSPLS